MTKLNVIEVYGEVKHTTGMTHLRIIEVVTKH